MTGAIRVRQLAKRQTAVVEASVAAVEASSAANTTALADLTCVPTLAYAVAIRELHIEWNIPPAAATLTASDWVVTVNDTPQTTLTAVAANGVVALELTADAFYPISRLPEGAYSITVAYDGTDATFVDQVGAGRQIAAFTGVAAKAAFPRFDLAVMTGDSGAGGLTGLVPAPAAGDAAAGKYLDSDGAWTVPPTSTAGHVIEDEATPLTQRANMNFTGAGVSVADTGGKTVVTIAGGAGEAFPVGAVFIAVVSTNPGTLLGYGTWSAFGAGKVLVGLDSVDTDFDTVEETGGAKTKAISAHAGATVDDHAAHVHSGPANHSNHQHVYTETPNHVHVLNGFPTATGGSTGFTRDTSMSGTPADTALSTNDPTGGVAVGTTSVETAAITHGNTGNPTATITHTVGQANAHSDLNVVQPYIVVYMWKRTA